MKNFIDFIMNEKFEGWNKPKGDGPNKPKVWIEWYEYDHQKKSEEWHLNGRIHREDGPAVTEWYEDGMKWYDRWFLNDKLHREDGPAEEIWWENGEKILEKYYLNGKEYSRHKWIEQLKNIGSKHYEEQKLLYDMEIYNI